ncbi:hypothetical protein MJH12_12605 [bacterium]|nr:hypothetical protein [bacterium]
MNITKRSIQFLVLALIALSTFTHAEKVNAESAVKLILLDELRSGRSKVGSEVNFKVDENITDSNGTLLIRKGTQAYGTILRSRKAGAWGRRGILEVEVTYTTAINGERVNLRAYQTKAGSGNKRLITTGAWLVAWPLAFIRGSNVVIKSGSPLIAWLDDVVTMKANSNTTEMTTPVVKKTKRFLRERKY